jgi:hypothetical protein
LSGIGISHESSGSGGTNQTNACLFRMAAPFNLERHLVNRQVYKQRRSIALAEWRALAG